MQPSTVYADVTFLGDGFVAVGATGRLDMVDTDVNVQNIMTSLKNGFSQVLSAENTALAGRAKGIALFLDTEGETRLLEIETKKSLTSVCRFGRQWLTGSEKGTIYRSEDGQKWISIDTGSAGTVTRLAATGVCCIGVTDAGEILVTDDVQQWTVMNYNEYYSFDPAVEFEGIEALNGTFWAYGTKETGEPHLAYSQAGGVWAVRDLYIMDGDQSCYISAPITGLCSDGQQILGTMEDGNMITLPMCVSCNKITAITTIALKGIACNGGTVLAVDEEGAIYTQPVEAVRQDRMTKSRKLGKRD